MEHRTVDLPHIRLHAVTAGTGPLVVLLHGFPECWYSWRHQIPALAAAGFRALAVDMRGYNLSDKPAGIREYAADKLVADVASLIEQESIGPAYLVGHDWGGVVAWRCAALHPQLIAKLAILNAPHPAIYQRTLWRSPTQCLRSAYVALFQLPWLPEWLLRSGDFWLIERALHRQAPGAFTSADIAEYKSALRQPGALTSALHYYRAAFSYPRSMFTEPQQVNVPTLLIWGERDPYLALSLTRNLEPWISNFKIKRIAAGHWVQNEQPELVNRLLVEFLNDLK
jgi:pimeloyl-ACP methyl ester carboxylesterase